MNKTYFKKSIIFLMVAVFLIATVGCSQKAGKNETKLEQIKKNGKIVLGTSADYPPYEFHKNINGKDEIIGFDIQLAKEIAKDLGVQLEIKDMKFDGLLAALDSGNIDFVVAGMTPTPERKQNVDFSKLYYKAIQSIVAKTTDKDKIKTLNDLKGKKIGVQKGSVQEQIVKDQLKNSEAVSLGKVSDIMLALKNNKVDAAIVEFPVASAYVSKNTDLFVSDVKIGAIDEGSAIAIKKGNQDLVDSINKTIDRLTKNKEIDKMVTEATEAIE